MQMIMPMHVTIIKSELVRETKDVFPNSAKTLTLVFSCCWELYVTGKYTDKSCKQKSTSPPAFPPHRQTYLTQRSTVSLRSVEMVVDNWSLLLVHTAPRSFRPVAHTTGQYLT